MSKPSSTIASTLVAKAKHKLAHEQKSSIVYGIKCSCSGLYVGETGRELGMRIGEHRDGWRKGDPRSAFGAHKDCHPDFDETEILAHQTHPRLRLLYESAYIRAFGERDTIIKSPNDEALNRNAGTLFDQRWLPLIRDLRH